MVKWQNVLCSVCVCVRTRWRKFVESKKANSSKKDNGKYMRTSVSEWVFRDGTTWTRVRPIKPHTWFTIFIWCFALFSHIFIFLWCPLGGHTHLAGSFEKCLDNLWPVFICYTFWMMNVEQEACTDDKGMFAGCVHWHCSPLPVGTSGNILCRQCGRHKNFHRNGITKKKKFITENSQTIFFLSFLFIPFNLLRRCLSVRGYVSLSF